MDYTAQPGDVWKKDGPIGALEVVLPQFPDRGHYDGGLTGVGCNVTTMSGDKATFIPARDDEQFAKTMHDHGRELVRE